MNFEQPQPNVNEAQPDVVVPPHLEQRWLEEEGARLFQTAYSHIENPDSPLKRENFFDGSKPNAYLQGEIDKAVAKRREHYVAQERQRIQEAKQKEHELNMVQRMPTKPKVEQTDVDDTIEITRAEEEAKKVPQEQVNDALRKTQQELKEAQENDGGTFNLGYVPSIEETKQKIEQQRKRAA